MQKNIDVLHVIDETALRSNAYFASLCEEAFSCGLLAAADVERIQTELYLLLGNICGGIAEKGTSSIKIDTAEDISESVMYTLSVRLKQCASPEQAVKLLQNEKIEELFEQGRKELLEKFINTRAKWTVLQKKLFKTESRAFNETIGEGMKAFIANYNYKLFAQKSIILFDYPVYNDIQKLSGIELISKKLDGFICENKFLNNFDYCNVHSLMCLLDELYSNGKENGDLPFYYEAPVNIYFYVLACALGLVLCSKDPFSLKLEKADAKFLRSRLFKKDYHEVLAVLLAAAEKLIFELKPDEETAFYINQSIRKLAGEIAFSYGLNIRSIFLCGEEKGKEQRFKLESLPRMSDSDFRFVLSQMSKQKNITSLSSFVGENVKNETDFEELAKAALLERKEIVKCISKLENPCLLLLLKKHLLSKSDKENEAVSQAVREFFHRLPENKKQQLKQLLRVIA